MSSSKHNALTDAQSNALGSFDSEFWRFLLGRLLIAILTLLAVSFMIYGLIELMPGDYAERELFRKYSGTGVTITQAEIDQVRANLGLDRPFLVRYGEWLWNVVTRFDFGPAFRVETSVNWSTLARRLRSYLLASRQEEYVLAAKLSGASGWRIVTRHLLPGFASYIIVELVSKQPEDRDSVAAGGTKTT